MNNLKKSKNTKKNIDYENFMNEKTDYIQSIIRKTILSIKENIKNELFSNNDSTLSINLLIELYEKTKKISQKIINKNYAKDFQDILKIYPYIHLFVL